MKGVASIFRHKLTRKLHLAIIGILRMKGDLRTG